MSRMYSNTPEPRYVEKAKMSEDNGRNVDYTEVDEMSIDEQGVHLTFENGTKMLLPLFFETDNSIEKQIVDSSKVRFTVNRQLQTISESLSSVISSESNPSICFRTDEEVVLQYSCDDSHELPESVTVTGATIESWELNDDSTEGILTLSTITGNVTVSITSSVIPDDEEQPVEPQ